MNNKKIALFLILSGIFVCGIAFAVMLGGSRLSITDIFYALMHPKVESQAATIIWQLRIPRVVMGLLVGSGLACCGVVFQAVLRNSLAEPYTLGVANGAALGAITAIILNLTGICIAGFSFLGSLITIFLVYAIASRKRFSNTTLILGGVTLGFLYSSVILLLFALAKKEGVHSAILWLMGDLSYTRPHMIIITASFVLSGVAVLIFFARDLDIICLGDQKARHLGLNVVFIKSILFLVSSVITGVCVSFVGIIGFVGLIIPHICRFLFGVNHRLLLITSAILGAAFLIICDTMARFIARPLELPVGVITGIFGGLFFLGLLLKSKKWEIF